MIKQTKLFRNKLGESTARVIEYSHFQTGDYYHCLRRAKDYQFLVVSTKSSDSRTGCNIPTDIGTKYETCLFLSSLGEPPCSPKFAELCLTWLQICSASEITPSSNTQLKHEKLHWCLVLNCINTRETLLKFPHKNISFHFNPALTAICNLKPYQIFIILTMFLMLSFLV